MIVFAALDNSKLLAKVQDRERIEATKFREAGMGPIQKTYSYDPTKVKKASQGQGQPSKSASTGTAEKAASSRKNWESTVIFTNSLLRILSRTVNMKQIYWWIVCGILILI